MTDQLHELPRPDGPPRPDSAAEPDRQAPSDLPRPASPPGAPTADITSTEPETVPDAPTVRTDEPSPGPVDAAGDPTPRDPGPDGSAADDLTDDGPTDGDDSDDDDSPTVVLDETMAGAPVPTDLAAAEPDEAGAPA